jgi:hypothetical protein
MSDRPFHIQLSDGVAFESREQYAEACGYSLSYIATLRRKGLGWQAIWNRKRNGTPAQKAKLKRKARRRAKDMSLFEPVEE